MKYYTITYRGLLAYILIAIAYRFMGKREIGELSVMDLVVSIFIAEIAAISIENYKQSIFVSVIPIALLIILQVLSSKFSLKSKKARNIIDGKPSVIINRGKINFKEMKKQRYNIDDLLMQLREESIKTIEDVDYAILETSGRLSIFLKEDDNKHNYPLPIILNSKIDQETLIQIGKSEKWLRNELQKNHLNIDNVFYAFYKDKDLYVIENNKIK